MSIVRKSAVIEFDHGLTAEKAPGPAMQTLVHRSAHCSQDSKCNIVIFDIQKRQHSAFAAGSRRSTRPGSP